MTGEIVNKIAESGIVTIDLEKYYPQGEWAAIDIKDYLFMGMILKEKEFRKQLQDIDWESYRNKNVAVFCSADALVPNWAYMLLAVSLEPVAKTITVGTQEQAVAKLIVQNIAAQLDATDLHDVRVVIKGCGKVEIPADAYLEISRLLRPYAKSLMYGEPCSTVPVYKKKG